MSPGIVSRRTNDEHCLILIFLASAQSVASPRLPPMASTTDNERRDSQREGDEQEPPSHVSTPYPSFQSYLTPRGVAPSVNADCSARLLRLISWTTERRRAPDRRAPSYWILSSPRCSTTRPHRRLSVPVLDSAPLGAKAIDLFLMSTATPSFPGCPPVRPREAFEAERHRIRLCLIRRTLQPVMGSKVERGSLRYPNSCVRRPNQRRPLRIVGVVGSISP